MICPACLAYVSPSIFTLEMPSGKDACLPSPKAQVGSCRAAYDTEYQGVVGVEGLFFSKKWNVKQENT